MKLPMRNGKIISKHRLDGKCVLCCKEKATIRHHYIYKTNVIYMVCYDCHKKCHSFSNHPLYPLDMEYKYKKDMEEIANRYKNHLIKTNQPLEINGIEWEMNTEYLIKGLVEVI